ncbi:MAG: CoA transferase, partial [Candidatus Binatia bacterium]
MSDRGPLSTVRVLECAEGLTGPVAGWLLAEAGAEVLKVEPPGGDRLRGSPGFHVIHRGKRGVVLDLVEVGGREECRGLVAAGVVVVVDEIESRLERIGLGYDPVRAPSLVWCSVTTFGREGPRAGLPPDDALVEAASGISAMQWSYAGTPVCFVTPMASYAGGFLAALGIAAALRARSLDGKGQRIDTSGLAGAMLLQSGTYVTGAGHEGSLAAQADDPRGVFPTYGLYRTSDGWIFVGALTEAFWTSLAT